MPLFAGHDRGELRAVWREAWRRHRARLPLEPLEAQLAELVELHPEYHPLLEAEPEAAGRDWTPEPGDTNPFLHLGLHAAAREGIATDRPQGVRAAFAMLLARSANPHEAEHVLVECLGETLWEAGRTGLPPDERAYLERVRRRLSSTPR
jgi:hypothetical protein